MFKKLFQKVLPETLIDKDINFKDAFNKFMSNFSQYDMASFDPVTYSATRNAIKKFAALKAASAVHAAGLILLSYARENNTEFFYDSIFDDGIVWRISVSKVETEKNGVTLQ